MQKTSSLKVVPKDGLKRELQCQSSTSNVELSRFHVFQDLDVFKILENYYTKNEVSH